MPALRGRPQRPPHLSLCFESTFLLLLLHLPSSTTSPPPPPPPPPFHALIFEARKRQKGEPTFFSFTFSPVAGMAGARTPLSPGPAAGWGGTWSLLCAQVRSRALCCVRVPSACTRCVLASLCPWMNGGRGGGWGGGVKERESGGRSAFSACMCV